MNLGLAIFLSAIFLGSIWLYYITRDRWNWKKIIKWSSIVILIGFLTIVVIGLFNLFNTFSSLEPQKAKELWGISLGQSSRDVKFSKGEPYNSSTDDVWIYRVYAYSSREKNIIVFNNEKVVCILSIRDSKKLLGKDWSYYSTKRIEKEWGKPEEILYSNDDLQRFYFYDSYNLVFLFKQKYLYGIGIYLPPINKDNLKELIRIYI